MGLENVIIMDREERSCIDEIIEARKLVEIIIEKATRLFPHLRQG